MRLYSVLVSLLYVHYCDGYKVLLVFPLPYKSHGHLGAGFVRNLLNAGHEVTYITTFPLNITDNKLRQIAVNQDFKIDHIFNIKYMLEGKFSFDGWGLIKMFMDIAETTLEDPNMQKFFNETNVYDVAILEWMMVDIYSGFSAVYDCPYVWFFTYAYYYEALRLMHTIPNPSYMAHTKSLNVAPLSFIQRIHELWYSTTSLLARNFIYAPLEENVYKRKFGPVLERQGKVLPSYEATKHNASLALINSHISLNDQTELPAAIKMIGGFHIKTPLDPLPNYFQDIMDSSPQGVILFSMGSQLKISNEQYLTDSLLKIFSKLKYTVLWKDSNKMSNVPKNVVIEEWIPQIGVLAHTNCVLFITHGGILSLAESVTYGVPIIGIPVFGDQFMNVKSAVKNGFGQEVKLSLHMADDIFLAIEEVLGNPRYTEKAKEMSVIFHDRLVQPGVELVHWVEHVVKTRGAPHLRSTALMMPWYQKIYFDLLAVLVIVFYLLRKLYKRLMLLFKTSVKSTKID